MNIKYRLITILVGLAPSFSCCEYINYIDKETEVITIFRNADAIKNITANASCRILLEPNTTDKIKIEGQRHLVEDFSIDNNSGTLNITHETNTLQKKKLVTVTVPHQFLENITFNKPCELMTTEYITIDNLSLIMNGSAEFTESNLQLHCKNLNIYCYGNSNIGQHQLKGTTNDFYLHIEGRIKINALDFAAQNIKFINKSGRDSYLNAENHLTINTYSSGNTYYINTPEIIHERIHVPYLNSTGQVIKYE